VDHWLEKAAARCRRFNHEKITKIRISELQADEICTLVGGKDQPPVWIFAAIEVCSRLWPSTAQKRLCDFHRCLTTLDCGSAAASTIVGRLAQPFQGPLRANWDGSS
jgi:hypothetical protein